MKTAQKPAFSKFNLKKKTFLNGKFSKIADGRWAEIENVAVKLIHNSYISAVQNSLGNMTRRYIENQFTVAQVMVNKRLVF